jgi:invasion protein IalB
MFDSFKILRLAIVLLGLISLAQCGFAQDAKKAKAAAPSKIEKFGNWTVICPPVGDKSGARCVAQFVLADAKRKTMLVSWRIGYNKEQLLVIDLVTPTEVFVGPGVQIIVGAGAPLKLPYVSCGVQGCLSRLPIDAGMMARLRATPTATIAVAGTNRKILQLKLDMTGLSEALTAISKS